ncbi:cell division protein FtsA [uncultured Algimonas sp.]|uniref:cell division protein FtsA n=1 Tax=uncultured Algimonas sp. TaxID=1547920 RepID=UPI00261B6874|nr:cell division protein FtsA [uncultured Algimonas sp.]
MRSGSPDTVCVIDLGSSKVACLIGRKDPSVGVRLLGSGTAISGGVKAGAVVDLDAAEIGIRKAVEKAERAAGVSVHGVIVNVGLRSLTSRHLRVQTEFASGAIADRDLKRVIGSSLTELAEPDYAILHALPRDWEVDGETGIRDPRGMFGQRLGVDMHFVTAGIGPLRNLAHCIERCHLSLRSVTVSPYAAAQSVLTEDERDLGVTLIDMGAGLTTVAVFRDNTLVHVDAVGVGGRNVTADIAHGLNTPIEAAERIKLFYGSALHGARDDFEQIPCPPVAAMGELQHEPRSRLTAIIRARTEETLELVKDRLYDAGLDSYSGRQIVLTGGAAQLSGLPELTELVFNKRVRMGSPHGVFGLSDALSGPDFAVVTGLLRHAFEATGEAVSGPPDLSGRRYQKSRYSGNALSRSVQWLRENF